MKKYKIRVRVLPENVCCGFIIDSYNIVEVYHKFLLFFDELNLFDDYEIISIGEL